MKRKFKNDNRDYKSWHKQRVFKIEALSIISIVLLLWVVTSC